jgi:hypothetical protein
VEAITVTKTEETTKTAEGVAITKTMIKEDTQASSNRITTTGADNKTAMVRGMSKRRNHTTQRRKRSMKGMKNNSMMINASLFNRNNTTAKLTSLF